MSTAAKQARSEYKKQWREANKEHIAEYNREWHARPENKGKRKAYQASYWDRIAKNSDVTDINE